ncbi:hypothetical protein LSCM1_00036 [Leishmania martiniquensis]|uniref:Uncharacterized protein n=1 Tax=Leishmania martiniquensis TaxID=1580590 RepID=A0A836GH82_9TRYP|nr:hypothetical protein LSCM1_00036 [Leishmania martiniquensis]
MEDHDGDLSEVNAELLKLSANPEEWREQRRRAMKAKIFASGAKVGASSTAEAYVPTVRSAGSPPSSAPQPSPPSYAGQEAQVSQQAAESYILQQILSHKRRREQANSLQVNVPAGAPQPHPQQSVTEQQQRTSSQGEGLSLKEKLMRKYKRG